MNSDKLAIEQLAIQARRDFEDKVIPRSLLRSLYLEYDPHFSDIDGYIDMVVDNFPRKNRGLAAVYLKDLFKVGEIVEGQYIIDPHHILEIGKLIVDITADQYGGPPVYVGSLIPPWGRSSISSV